MTRGAIVALACSLAAASCGNLPLPAHRMERVVRPDAVMDFERLYSENCAGCHGPAGQGGAALGLANPVYLAIADLDTIRRVTADGVPGTAMPAFAQRSGGMLTDAQVDAIATGVRAWAEPGALGSDVPPPYGGRSGDPVKGAAAYTTFCASCHAPGGTGGERASSIVDAAFLALVSDQRLRTTVIAGRPDLGAPDWRANVPDRPMTADEVADVVAWLAAKRPAGGGR